MFNTSIRPLKFKESGLSAEKWRLLKALSSPEKVQDFLNSMPFNFERGGETHRSVEETLKRGRAHCFEGALVAAAAFWIHGRRPLLFDLTTIRSDLDHVVALFEKDGYWGAVSKTNHAVLRYREPIHRDMRELAASYFHEYFLPDGRKTLRSFSRPFDISKYGTTPADSGINWITTKENLAELAHMLDKSPHSKIISPKQVKSLRKADRIEIKAGGIVEYKR